MSKSKPKFPRKENDGHYHNQANTRQETIRVGNEDVTYASSWCSLCGKWTRSKVIQRKKRDNGKT